MLASPVPIYLGCAGLIVGSLGLGAQYMLGGNSISVTNSESEQPLFARSVEEATLPASNWSSQNSSVAYYEPMVKLLTTPSRSVPPAPATATPQAHAPQATPPSAPHEVVRDIPQQDKPSRRTRNAHTRDNATTEQVDPRDAYAKAERDPRSRERQRNTRQVDNERRDSGPLRSERRYGGRDDDETADTRPRSDRRRVDVEGDRPRRGERRVIVQEEPLPRIVRGPESRDEGFSPLRLFGIFER